MNRREFLETVAVAAVLPALARQDPANEWGSPVFDLHFHLRPQPARNLAHLDGAGVTKANLLTRGGALDQVKAAMAKKDAVIVDCREKSEWDEGHLDGALLLPLSWLRDESKGDQFAEKLAGKVPKKILYLHCRSGRRVLAAAAILRKQGYDARPLKAGFEDLKQAGFTVAN